MTTPEEARERVKHLATNPYAADHQIYWVKIFDAFGNALSSAELSEGDAWIDAANRLERASAVSGVD